MLDLMEKEKQTNKKHQLTLMRFATHPPTRVSENPRQRSSMEPVVCNFAEAVMPAAAGSLARSRGWLSPCRPIRLVPTGLATRLHTTHRF